MNAALVCPYCRSEVPAQAFTERCDRCLALYHAECWKEYGRCSVFGCAGRRWRKTRQAFLFVPAVLWLLAQLHVGLRIMLSPLLVPAIVYCCAAAVYYWKHIYTDLRTGVSAGHDLLFFMINAAPILRATIMR